MPLTLPSGALPPGTLPPPGQSALLLDLDGTLLDIAPTPDEVRVPPGLLDSLQRLRNHLGGALAVVTGRPIAQIDELLGAVPYAVAGEHGGAIRHAPGAPVLRASLPDPPVAWTIEAARIVEAHPGAMLEQKQRGFVFHYRAVPDAGPALRGAALALIAPQARQFGLVEASMAWEVRPRGVDKGSAVAALMTDAPFAGRLPIFIGDDVTDEDGMRAAQEMQGTGLRVQDWFTDPPGVRAWLARCADALDGGTAEWPAP